MIESQSAISKESVLDSFSMQAGYITPKVDVRGAVVDYSEAFLEDNARRVAFDERIVPDEA